MTIQSDAAKAEQLTRRRARMLPVLAVLFLGQQVSYFGSIEGDRAVDHVKISAWIVLSIVLLLALTTGGGWIYSKQVRDLANDESTRAHRADGFRWGFVAAMGANASEGAVEEDWLGAPMYFSHHDAATNRALVEEAGFRIEAARVEVADEDVVPSPFLWVVARTPEGPTASNGR